MTSKKESKQKEGDVAQSGRVVGSRVHCESNDKPRRNQLVGCSNHPVPTTNFSPNSIWPLSYFFSAFKTIVLLTPLPLFSQMFPSGLFIGFAICGFFVLVAILITLKRRSSLSLSTKSIVKKKLLRDFSSEGEDFLYESRNKLRFP